MPSGVSSPEYCACPTASFAASLHEMRCTAERASFPAISISPMWLTSNSPARWRTAMCSATMPEYSTGMSQPPKATIFAPDARWRALSGVFLRGASVACSIGMAAAERFTRERVTVLCAIETGQEMPRRDGYTSRVASLAVLALILAAIALVGRRSRTPGRRSRPGPGTIGTVYDFLNEERRRAIEIIVEQRAEARDPEEAEGNLPDLEHPGKPPSP